MANSIDDKLKKAQHKGVSRYFVFGLLGGSIVFIVLFWLLLVKGFAIHVTPEEAQPTVSVDIVKGMGVVSGGKAYVVSQDTLLSVGAERFESKHVSLKNVTSSNVEVTLEPSPATLISAVSVQNGETSWYINSRLENVGATLEEELPPGAYDILVDNPYYATYSTSVMLERGLPYSLEVELDKIKGVVALESKPAGAQVYVNEKLQGITPLTFEESGGAYQLRIELPGYQTINDVIEITNVNGKPSRHYLMSPEQAELLVVTEPEGGLLMVDGSSQEVGKLFVDSGFKHNLSYQLPGYYTESQSVLLKPGEKRQLVFKLKPEIGEVILESTKTATVTSNGKAIGQTPFSLKAKAVPIELQFSAPGYRTVTKVVTPSGKNTTKVSVEMLTEFEARRREGLPLFISKLGIQMAKFRGTKFMMGSPSSEIGRKRNEHQLQVSFDKQFWVSRHEITEAQYRAYDSGRNQSSLPITNVTWLDAAMYCNWLSEQEGLPQFYNISGGRLTGVNIDSKGYRLPTEAEWEWLAKKSKRAKETTFVWGSHERIPKDIGNFGDQSISGKQPLILQQYNDGYAGKAPVGSFKQDRAGLFDLAGNVSEWVHDLYTNNPPDNSVTHINYLGASRGLQHVIKGANYKSGRLKELRAAKREFSDKASEMVGFRIARYQ